METTTLINFLKTMLFTNSHNKPTNDDDDPASLLVRTVTLYTLSERMPSLLDTGKEICWLLQSLDTLIA